MNKNIKVQRNIIKAIIALIILMIAMIIAYSLYQKDNDNSIKAYSESGFFYDTFIEITVYSNNEEGAKTALNIIMDQCSDYEMLFSKTLVESEIYKLNTERDVIVSSTTSLLLNYCVSMYYITNGYFDISTGTYLEGFDTETCSIYDEETVSELLEVVDIDNLCLNTDDDGVCYASLIDDVTTIDLGGAAKGFIADRISNYLKSSGFTDFIINLGGNLLVSGYKNSENGNVYSLGIQKPFDSQGSVMLSITGTDMSVVTSGIYERYFVSGDKIYHHIFDPFTGYPVENNLYSVTIIGEESFMCDCFSTAVFVMGLTEGMEFINNYDGYEAVFIDDQYNVYVSDGLVYNEEDASITIKTTD